MDRYVGVMKTAIVVSLIGIVVLGGLIVWQIVRSGGSDAPRSELERGVVTAEEAVEANPDDPVARIKLAAAYLEQGSVGLAEEQAKAGLRLAPEEPAGHYVMGLVLVERGRVEEAIEELETAAANKGQLAQFYQDAYLALARAQERAGDRTKAARAYQKAIDQGPENAIVLYERGRFFERGKEWQNALYDYGWAITYSPGYEDAEKRFIALKRAHPIEFAKLSAQAASESAVFAP